MIVTGWEDRAGHESIGILHAVDPETDETFRVATDWRPFEDIVAAVSDGNDVEIEPEGWQILGSVR